MEENNPHLEYRSVNNAAHMCGHDGHTACLLGGISKILENIHTIPNNKIIRFLFQPAEEIVGGAPVMIKDGCLDYVNEIYGMHNYHLPLGEIHCIEGPNKSERSIIEITIIGKGGQNITLLKAQSHALIKGINDTENEVETRMVEFCLNIHHSSNCM